eukprot:1159482-Pelagomonas_calceolata.AAC.6
MAQAALGRAMVAAGGTMLALGGATMVVSTASMTVTRLVVDKRKVQWVSADDGMRVKEVRNASCPVPLFLCAEAVPHHLP